MVQFCPKCGTKAPDDESAFCNRCGTRLPPVIPEKKAAVCPRCGAEQVDEQSAFCNKCGSAFGSLPAAPARTIPPAPPAPMAARPAVPAKNCRSCGAPVVRSDTDYCDVCREYQNRRDAPVSVTPAPEPAPQYREIPQPESTTAKANDAGAAASAVEKRGRPVVRIALIAVAAVLILAVIAAFVTGMIPGLGKSDEQSQITEPETTMPEETPPVAMTSPVPEETISEETIPEPVPSTEVPVTTIATTAPVTLPVNSSLNGTANASVNSPANVSANITKPVSNINPLKPFAIGQNATDGKGQLTVHGIAFKDKISDPTPSYAIGKKYLIVNITYENLEKNATQEIVPSLMLVRDGGGFAYEPVTDVLLENPFYIRTIPAGTAINGNMLYCVPPEATLLKFEYSFGGRNTAVFQLT